MSDSAPKKPTALAPNLTGSLAKGLAMIEVLCCSETPLGVSRLAEQLAMPKSGVHRLLQLMLDFGWVRQTQQREYECTLRLFELGMLLANRVDLRHVADRWMRELASRTMESVHLSVLDGSEVIYLDKIESSQPIRAYTRIGGRAPAYCVATGKCQLAYAEPEAIAGLTLAAHTPATITQYDVLLRELKEVRAQGFALNRGEWRSSVYGIAAPVMGKSGRVIASIGISGPAERFAEDRIADLSTLVAEAARNLSAECAHII
jgi:DNA-binding IclR family transcriptional regulator